MQAHQPEMAVPDRDACTGAAWLSSARAVRCWVKSRNERNPCRRLPMSDETATINVEEGGDDVKSARPLRDRKSTRLNSSHLVISYAVFCLKKKKNFNRERPQIKPCSAQH